MKWFHWWKKADPEGLQYAKQADEDATERLEAAKKRTAQVRRDSSWVDPLMARNHLTSRFIDTLRHGGNA